MNEKYRKSVKRAVVITLEEFERLLYPMCVNVEYTYDGFEYTDNCDEIVDKEDIFEFLSECFEATVIKVFTDSEAESEWKVWIELE